MSITIDPRSVIRRRMAALGISTYQLANLVGVAQPNLVRTLNRGPSPAERILARCQVALDREERRRGNSGNPPAKL